jgi:cell division protease FtsH
MMIHDLRVSLAGRVVEEIIYGDAEVSDLAAHDLERAATTLKAGVLKYGLQFASNLPTLPAVRGDSTVSDSVFAQLISIKEWRNYLEREYEIATQIAVRYRSLIEVIQQRLIAERVLFRDDLEAMWRSYSEKEQRLCQAAA